MHTTISDSGKHAGFAVIRSYQPIRIEREFELAGRGAMWQSDGIDGGQKRHDPTTESTAQRDASTPFASELGDAEKHPLERAA